MIVQPKGHEMLFLAMEGNEQGEKQADPATVHILQLAEVQNDCARGWGTGLRGGLHQRVFCESGDFALDIDDTGCGTYFTNVHYYFSLRHAGSSSFLFSYTISKKVFVYWLHLDVALGQ